MKGPDIFTYSWFIFKQNILGLKRFPNTLGFIYQFIILLGHFAEFLLLCRNHEIRDDKSMMAGSCCTQCSLCTSKNAINWTSL